MVDEIVNICFFWGNIELKRVTIVLRRKIPFITYYNILYEGIESFLIGHEQIVVMAYYWWRAPGRLRDYDLNIDFCLQYINALITLIVYIFTS